MMDYNEEFPMADTLERTPNILVVEDSSVDRHRWDKLNDAHADINIKCFKSVNVAMIEWLNLYSYDHIPRVLVFDWEQRCTSIGCLTRESETGTSYSIDGVGFALHCCMSSVHEGEGLFIAYTKNSKTAEADLASWPQSMRAHMHIMSKDIYSPKRLLDWITMQEQFAGVRQLNKVYNA